MPRKTRERQVGVVPRPLASMRPRPDAAENGISTGGATPGWGCFNEAAARCRGKPAQAIRPTSAPATLQ